MTTDSSSEPQVVSFIIPCFNSEDTLHSCLQHLKNLDYPNDCKQIVVVDNGSSDKSTEIAQSFTEKVFVDTEATIAGLRNLGAKQSTGTVLVFVDSDCLLSSDWLSVSLPYFEDSKVGMVGAKTHILSDDANWVAQAWSVHLERSAIEETTEWFTTRALAIKKSVFDEVGGFDTEKITCEDVKLGHDVGLNYKIVADERLAPVHLNESTTLLEWFNKERWRGRNSIDTSIEYLRERKNIFSKEALSFALPFYYIISFFIFVVAIILLVAENTFSVLFVALFVILLPIVGMSFSTCLSVKKWWAFFPLIPVYGTYILARVCALLDSIKRY